MGNPEVKITKLERRPDGSFGPEARLGAQSAEEISLQTTVTGLLRRMAERAKEIFLLEWEGSKIPRGAVVNGKSIAWTQHGLVTSDAGEQIGTYERTVEFGGESGRAQAMLIFVN
jgi:hypothetical protein